MRRFRFSLQTALDQALRLEEEASLTLAAAQAEQARQERVIAALEEQADAAARALTALQQSGELDLPRVTAQRLHLEDTWSQLAEQRLALAELIRKVEECRAHVVECMKKREVLERLKELHAETHRREALAEEGRMLDEVASARYSRREVKA